MNKILVEVFLPALGQSYDVFIPLESQLSEVILLLTKVLNDLSSGCYIAGEDAILCDRETGNIFSINMSVYELGLKSGSKLMLI
jgi:hypothetical protein